MGPLRMLIAKIRTFVINPFADETPLQFHDSHQRGTFTCETNLDNFKVIAQIKIDFRIEQIFLEFVRRSFDIISRRYRIEMRPISMLTF